MKTKLAIVFVLPLRIMWADMREVYSFLRKKA